MLMEVGGSFTGVMTGNLNFMGRAIGTYSLGRRRTSSWRPAATCSAWRWAAGSAGCPPAPGNRRRPGRAG
jgi:hypothetical protein